MTDRVGVIATLRDEPSERVTSMLRALASQTGCDPFPVVLAIAGTEPFGALGFRPFGMIRSIDTVENPTGGRSSGLNLAARAVAAEHVCRVDARSQVPPHYVASCVQTLLDRPDIGVVGAVQHPTPGGGGAVANGIARALANPWLLGGAAYRVGRRSGPVDTVYLGGYRRGELLSLGGFDESLLANEDFDLCARYRSAGHAVMLDADLVVRYEARSTFGDLWRQYVDFGRSKVRYWRQTADGPNRRQLVALVLGSLAPIVGLSLLRHPRVLGLAVGGVMCGLLIGDAAIAGRAPVLTRLDASIASTIIAVGWMAGVAVEAVAHGPWRITSGRHVSPPTGRP